jgi:hypothetical protein
MIVEQYQSAGNAIMWEREKQLSQYSKSRFTKKICRRCKNAKETKGGTNNNFVFVCKDCNDKKAGI